MNKCLHSLKPPSHCRMVVRVVNVGVWAAEVWTVENNTSPNVDMFNLDYKRIVKHIYISSYN